MARCPFALNTLIESDHGAAPLIEYDGELLPPPPKVKAVAVSPTLVRIVDEDDAKTNR